MSSDSEKINNDEQLQSCMGKMWNTEGMKKKKKKQLVF